jgi:hypothetical protein
MGIEPTSEAWEASILPLYDARSIVHYLNHDGGVFTTSSITPSLYDPPVDRCGASPLLAINAAALNAPARAKITDAHTTAR